MNDVELLAAILANPSDVQPRLVYADWLLQREDPRGELVALQCAPEVTPEARTRIDDLLALHQQDWLAGTKLLPRHVRFERGFVEAIELSADELLELGDLHEVPIRVLDVFDVQSSQCAALAALPLLGRLRALKLKMRVRSTDRDAAIAELVSSPHLRLESLELAYNELNDAAVEAIASAERLRTLTTLDLTGNEQVTAGAVRALAASPWLQQLSDLRIGYNKIGDAGAIAALTGFPALRRLQLYSCGLGPAGAAAMAASPALSRLTSLTVTSNDSGDEGIRILASSPGVANLEQFPFHYSDLSARAAAAVAASPYLARLEVLDWEGNPIGDDGLVALSVARKLRPRALIAGDCNLSVVAISALVRSPVFMQLRELRLAGNAIGDEAAFVLAAWPGLATIRKLNLRDTNLGPEGALALARSPYLQVTDLEIGNNAIGDTGLAAFGHLPLERLHARSIGATERGVGELLASPRCAALGLLELDGNAIGNGSARAIGAATHVTELRALHLGDTGIDDDGVTALAGVAHLARLENLVLAKNPLGPRAAQVLAESPTFARLTSLDLYRAKLGEQGLAALIEGRQLQRIRHLKLPFSFSHGDAIRARFGPRAT